MQTTPVKLWDLPTRLFHWSLVLGIVFAWISAETGGNWMVWHVRAGVFILSLVLFRLIWGIVGSETSRFSHFITSPMQTLKHLKDSKNQSSFYYAGHNPMGAWMIVALLTFVAIQAVTGLFAYDDISIEGPLFNLVSEKTADLLTKLHHINFNLIILFAALHIATILVYRFFKNTNFIKAMVTGSADWPLSQQPIPHDANLKSPLLAAGIWAGGYILIQIIFKVIGS